ncbi:SURF1 family cytochrome oxidase biogenesis protein [Croceicoccus sp. F390]|uniref:SURF1-like protein n=1 Tax=Croceicoccus esteveae TaxID=3075597 RepID=A0ABU2ZI31_9SPHN|nr:SURF1 family cytochrome oxidase biogenesis protein [Croceicoccus sp. F390]MDT0575249.1 SURF1 family cytochrome oxidase biogenesis protein [Croceicoccus sp. F390]
MIRRLPILPTIIVLAAALIMVGLGIWQYQRAGEKTALIQYYKAAGDRVDAVAFPTTDAANEASLYRRSSFSCRTVLEMGAIGATAADGTRGWGQTANCRLADGSEAQVMLGWMSEPTLTNWQGGDVSGIVAPAGRNVRLMSDPPQAGLRPLAAPDPRNLPNNHMTYMVQWFFFAATALIIYGLAVRARLARRDEHV